MKLSIHTILAILGEADALFTKHGFYDADGNFGQITAQEVVAFIPDFEAVLKNHGLKIEAKVDHIIAIVPLLLGALTSDR